jgi:hypothetical protein
MSVFEGAFQNIVNYTAGSVFERTFISRFGDAGGRGSYYDVPLANIGTCGSNTCVDTAGSTSTYSVSRQLLVQIDRVRDYFQQVGFNRCLFDETDFTGGQLIHTGSVITNSDRNKKFGGLVNLSQTQLDSGVAGAEFVTGCNNIDTDNPFYEDYPAAYQEFGRDGDQSFCCESGLLRTTGAQTQSDAIPDVAFKDLPPFMYDGASYQIIAARTVVLDNLFNAIEFAVIEAVI